MIPYILVFLLSIFVLLRTPSKKAGRFLFCVLFFMSAFRGMDVGTDTKNYTDEAGLEYKAFRMEFDSDNLQRTAQYELTYVLLLRIVFGNNLNPRFILIAFSFLTFLFLYLSVKHIRYGLLYACIIYFLFGFFTHSLNWARQLSACSVLLYAYKNLIQNKDGKFFIYLIFACTIHFSSIFFAILYPLKYLPRISKSFGEKITILIIIVTAVYPMTGILFYLLSFIDIGYIEEYAVMIGFNAERSIVGIVFGIITQVLCLYIFHIAVKRDTLIFKDILFLLSVMMGAIFASLPWMIGRLLFGFYIYQCLYLSEIINDIVIDNNKALPQSILKPFLLLCFLSGLAELMAISEGSLGIVPYTLGF